MYYDTGVRQQTTAPIASLCRTQTNIDEIYIDSSPNQNLLQVSSYTFAKKTPTNSLQAHPSPNELVVSKVVEVVLLAVVEEVEEPREVAGGVVGSHAVELAEVEPEVEGSVLGEAVVEAGSLEAA